MSVVQVTVGPEPTSAQLVLGVQKTLPVGVVAPVVDVSVTVAVQNVGWLTTMLVSEQLMLVVVLWAVTVIVTVPVPLLPACIALPP
jgi:hypothetical protein